MQVDPAIIATLRLIKSNSPQNITMQILYVQLYKTLNQLKLSSNTVYCTVVIKYDVSQNQKMKAPFFNYQPGSYDET